MGWLTFVSDMSTTQETVDRPHDWWWHGGNALYNKGNWLVSRREKVEPIQRTRANDDIIGENKKGASPMPLISPLT